MRIPWNPKISKTKPVSISQYLFKWIDTKMIDFTLTLQTFQTSDGKLNYVKIQICLQLKFRTGCNMLFELNPKSDFYKLNPRACTGIWTLYVIHVLTIYVFWKQFCMYLQAEILLATEQGKKLGRMRNTILQSVIIVTAFRVFFT